MQGSSGLDRELVDAEALVGHLVRPGSMYAFLAEHRRRLFPDVLFADLFGSGRGRPSQPGELVATVMVLQSLEGLSDRDAIEALRTDLRWKVAAGLALTDEGFHPTVLTYWRRKLGGSKDPERIFSAVRAVVKETGVLAGKTRRALDSTLLDDAVATQDTVTQLVSMIRRVRRQVPEAAGVEVVGDDYEEASGKPMCAWDDPDARDALVTRLVNDAVAILDALDGAELDDDQSELVGLLALVAGQDVEPGDDEGSWKIARKVGHHRVISTVDPESRHMHKSRSSYRDGYKAHIAAEPTTGLITACELTPANTGDGTVAVDLLAADPTITTEPAAGPATTGDATADATGDTADVNADEMAGVETAATGDTADDDDGAVEVLADSAYGSGPTLAALTGAGYQCNIKPWPLVRNRHLGDDQFNRDDFTIDYNARTVTCPNQVTVKITEKGNATFGVKCNGCPLRSRCTAAKDGKAFTVGEHDQLLADARARWRNGHGTDDYQAYRPLVERSIAWIVRNGHRRVRYRGVERNQLGLSTRAAVINLQRLINLGLDWNGTWHIAT